MRINHNHTPMRNGELFSSGCCEAFYPYIHLKFKKKDNTWQICRF
jgi:hypothetical protein